MSLTRYVEKVAEFALKIATSFTIAHLPFGLDFTNDTEGSLGRQNTVHMDPPVTGISMGIDLQD